MTISDAKRYVGKDCRISWADRSGEHSATMHIEELQFVPMYGAYLICDHGEVHLDRIVDIRLAEDCIESLPQAA